MNEKPYHKFNAIRKTLGMHQYAFAKHLGIAQGTASAYARGRNPIPPSVMKRAERLYEAVMPISHEPRPVKHQHDRRNHFDRYGESYKPTFNERDETQVFQSKGTARIIYQHGKLVIESVFDPELE